MACIRGKNWKRHNVDTDIRDVELKEATVGL